MKRLLMFPFTVLLIIFLTACTKSSGVPIEPNDENMLIHITNNANFDMYGVEVMILDFSQTIVNDDGSKIKKGDTFTFEILEDDLTLDGEATMKLSILTNSESDENIVPINKEVALTLEKNKELFFEITGESIEEADVKSMN